jgi:cation transport ATPase
MDTIVQQHLLDRYYAALKQAQLRLTPQRQTICEYLAGTDRHPTPYQVYADIAAGHPEISRATVYNTLNTLQQLGAIVEVRLDGRRGDGDAAQLGSDITLAVIAFAAGGYSGVVGAWEQARQGKFDIDFLMIAAALLGRAADRRVGRKARCCSSFSP